MATNCFTWSATGTSIRQSVGIKLAACLAPELQPLKHLHGKYMSPDVL
jgi:hypothetical protein